MKLSEHIAECNEMMSEHGDLEILYLEASDDAERSLVAPVLSLTPGSVRGEAESFVMIHGDWDTY